MSVRPALLIRLGLLPLGALALTGCVVSTVAEVATAPVRAVGQGVDWATTSQSEADEKRGREMRERDERLGKLDKQYRRHTKDCQNGDQDACQEAQATYDAIMDLRSR